MILAATKRYHEIYAVQISVSLGYGKLEMFKYFVREERVPYSTCICFIVISRFGFEGGILVLIVPVPAHCLLSVRRERGGPVVNASDSGSRDRGFEPHSGQTVLCP